MNKIIIYTSTWGRSPSSLAREVEKYMEDGYQPFGSPYIWGDHIYQTLVKYE